MDGTANGQIAQTVHTSRRDPGEPGSAESGVMVHEVSLSLLSDPLPRAGRLVLSVAVGLHLSWIIVAAQETPQGCT